MVVTGLCKPIYGALEILLGPQQSLLFSWCKTSRQRGFCIQEITNANFLMMWFAAAIG